MPENTTAQNNNDSDKRAQLRRAALEYHEFPKPGKIAIAEKNDQQRNTHNDGKYFAYISVMDNDIKRGESGNPVRTLRMRYDAWVKSGSQRLAPPPATLYQPKS